MNVADVMPGLLTLLHLVDLDVEALRLGPARVHAQQHLRPVLRVGAARAGVDLADRVALVVLAAEQRAQLEPVERRAQPRRPRPRSRLRPTRRPLRARARTASARRRPGARARPRARRRHAPPRARRVTLRRVVGVVPEVGRARLGSSSPSRARASSMRRYLWASATRRARSASSSEKSLIHARGKLVLLAAAAEARLVAAGGLFDAHRLLRDLLLVAAMASGGGASAPMS